MRCVSSRKLFSSRLMQNSNERQGGGSSPRLWLHYAQHCRFRLRFATLNTNGYIDMELTRFCGHPILVMKGGPRMPRTHAPYPAEFRQQIVELVRAGRKPFELAREF